MRRKLFSVAAILSLMLCLATVVLWVRSYSISGSGYFMWRIGNAGEERQRVYGSIIGAGGIGIFAGQMAGLQLYRSHLIHIPEPPEYPVVVTTDGTWGFKLFYALPPDPFAFEAVAPLWSVASIFLLLPIVFCARMLNLKAKNIGRCSKCGYSLTGNTSGICPECGTAIAEKAGA